MIQVSASPVLDESDLEIEIEQFHIPALENFERPNVVNAVSQYSNGDGCLATIEVGGGGCPTQTSNSSCCWTGPQSG